MKLKRTKLAALALTALMAVGATSLVAYASETDTAAATADTYSYTVDPNTVSSCVINSDGTATIKCPKTYAGTSGSTAVDYETFTATVYKTTDATCQKNKIVTYTYTYNSVAYYYDYEVADTKIDHTWSEVSVTTAATCTSTGVGTQYCTMCGTTQTVVLDKVDHTSKVTGYAKIDDITTAAELTAASSYTVTATSSTAYWNIKVDSSGDLVLGSDGLPQANIVTEDAYYYVTSVCSVCGATLSNVVVKIPATTAAYAKISAVNKITNLTVGDTYDISEIPLTESTLELTNCSATDAYYVVEFYSSNDEVVSELKVPVSAHHYEVTLIEFDSKADADQCTVVYNSDGTYKITNNSCYKTITYYEVTHCAASGTCSLSKCSTNASYVKAGSYTHSSLRKISSVTKTVEPSGSHSIDETAKAAITAEVASGTATYADLYNEFVSKSGANYSKYIKLVNNTSTCEADGTVDVQYICKICGEVVETKTVNVKAPGHTADTAVVENLVASTCSKNGSYDAVVYCVNKDLYGCTKVFSTTNVLIPRTKHTNEESVTSSGVGTEDVDDSLTASNIGIVFVGDVIIDPGVETITTGTVATINSGVATSKSSVYEYETTVNGVKTTVYLPCVVGYGNSATDLVASSTAYSVYAYVASYCDECGYEVMITEPYKLTLTVDSVTKEKSDGTAGQLHLQLLIQEQRGHRKLLLQHRPLSITHQFWLMQLEQKPTQSMV